ncbi:hypothetical protein EDB19DRAFT_1908435 [Suillus lakei]|nr:hypothetical protein EDB19DRAFT_1908435 [Suillus lakei]
MKDKETSSIKATSQTCPSLPEHPSPTSQTPRTGPKFFPPIPSLKTKKAWRNHIPFYQTPPSSPGSPPDTPTPIHREICVTKPQNDLPMFQEFKVVQSNETPADNVVPSDLNSSIHAPGNAMVDQPMGAPPSPPLPTRAQTAEEDNPSSAQNGVNHRTVLPQFTPTPIGGFPHVHMAHSAQIFDHLDNKVLLAWFQVEHPKFLVRVFDHSAKDIAEKTAIIAERIRASITTIADYVHQETPPIRVSPPQPQEETRNLIVNQRIWSSPDITFEALPFNCSQPPELLFCLSGFTTSDTDLVRKAVADVWSHDNHRHDIDDIFSQCGFQDDELVYKATRELIKSIRVEMLDFKVTGGLSVPRFNIFAMSPTNDAKTWTTLRGFLHLLEYPTGLEGCGTATALFPCQLCHSLAHPRGLCPFPLIPQWNGPKINNRNTASSTRQSGRSRGGRPGRNT